MSRVAVVEDHHLLAETLAAALQRSGVSARVVPLQSPSAMLADLCAEPADLVLLDLDLGEYGDSTGMVAELAGAQVRVLVVTGCADRLRIAAALEQGAIGYQSKAPGFEPLLARVHAALEATAALDPGHRLELLDELRRFRALRQTELAPFERLTEREAETLRALARGNTVTMIAAEWFVSEATMRSHVRSVLGKLGVSSQLAAVTIAVRSGWLVEAGPVAS
jgi:two-component system nitrate/nitrite response regulator NarL